MDWGPGDHSQMTASEALQQLRRNLEAIPGVRGVNKPHGIESTQDPVLLGLIMSELKARNLFRGQQDGGYLCGEVAVQYGGHLLCAMCLLITMGWMRLSQMEILLKSFNQRDGGGLPIPVRESLTPSPSACPGLSRPSRDRSGFKFSTP